MEEQNFVSFTKYYQQYKDKLDKKLNAEVNTIEFEECFLIDNYWFDILLYYYKSYNNMKKYKLKYSNKKNYYFPKENPKYIQSISEIINYINSKKKFTIINNNVIEFLNQEQLKNSKIFKIYIGYKKLIIEDPMNNNNALLLSNPLDENAVNRTVIQIGINSKDKNNIYESYLKKESYNNSNIKNDNKYNNNKNILSNSININENINSSKIIRLKISILLFYYEKYLISSKNKDNNNYYLINYNWMNKFKNFIKYKEICNLLKINDNIIKNKIDYDNINIDSFINDFYKEFYDEYQKLEFIDNFLKSPKQYEPITPSLSNLQNILYYSNCYILDFKIIDLIKKIISSVKLENPNKVIFKNNNIYLLLDNKNITLYIYIHIFIFFNF